MDDANGGGAASDSAWAGAGDGACAGGGGAIVSDAAVIDAASAGDAASVTEVAPASEPTPAADGAAVPTWWPPGATAEDVAEARRLYEMTATPVPEIWGKFGWTEYRLRKLQRAEGWTMRAAVAMPGPLRGRKPIGADRIEFRLHRLIVFGIGILERRAADAGLDAANAQVLVSLARAQEVMMRSARQNNQAVTEKKNKNDGTDFRDDPVWLAAEFARRFAGVPAPQGEGAGRVVRELDDRRAEDVSR